VKTLVGSLLFFAISASALAQGSRFPDSAVSLPSGWNGPVFKLSQNYPTQISADVYPWQSIDPLTAPNDYMQSVLHYCLAGNIEVDWVVQNNQTRTWYHAPWMHWGDHGREPIRGLTYEKPSGKGVLANTQTDVFQNWAVGFYNSPGGFTIGRVWSNALSPNPGLALFPENTVSCKLLFTEATKEQVPFLAGSLEWDAYIYTSNDNAKVGAPRILKKLRLLQLDIAVRDSRANSTTGWIFGTFIYDGTIAGNNPYARLRPVGLMWGDDKDFNLPQAQQGLKPKQTWLNPDAQHIMTHYGWLNRLNGPVDNAQSSCLSCHSTAQWRVLAPMVPPAGTPAGSPQWMMWFRDIGPGTTFSSGTASLDYSLQLAGGMQNLVAWVNTCAAHPTNTIVPPCPQAAFDAFNAHRPRPQIQLGYLVTRDAPEATRTKPAVSACGPVCGTERWPVKTWSDLDANKVSMQPVSQTVQGLVSLMPPATRPQNNRVAPIETTTFLVGAYLLGFKLEQDQDVHIVLGDERVHETMIVEIPNPKCGGVCSSKGLKPIQQARDNFLHHCGVPTSQFKKLTKPLQVRVTGVGFFDFNHHQTGVAKNAIELHPVLQIDFPDNTDDCARHVM